MNRNVMVSWFSRKSESNCGDDGSSPTRPLGTSPGGEQKKRSVLSWLSTIGSEDDNGSSASVESLEEARVQQQSTISEDPITTEPGTGLTATPTQNTTIVPHLSLPAFVEPSHIMGGTSLLFFFRAYRVYHSPLDGLVQKIAKRNHVTMAELEAADIAVRKAVGTAVAGRALRLATLISFGSFGMIGAGTFYYY